MPRPENLKDVTLEPALRCILRVKGGICQVEKEGHFLSREQRRL